MSKITAIAIEKACAFLDRARSPMGLMALPEGHPHVWARDGAITALGARLLPGHETCLRAALEILASQQSDLGATPNNVSVAAGRLDHTNASSVVSNLWFILSHYLQHRLFGDLEFLTAAWPALEQVFLWLRYHDSNGCGLLEVHEAADWATLFANRCNVLYDNVLWHAALRAMAVLARALGTDGAHDDELAADVRHKIRILDYVHQVGIAEPASGWTSPSCSSARWPPSSATAAR